MTNTLEKTVKTLPDAPGVYFMKDAKGNILYVGKAKSLRKRVNSYLRKDYEHSTRTQKLLEIVKDITVTRTDTELEALLLETNLIKEHRPKYNILMKDDKSYVYIAVNMDEDFPRIRVLREKDLGKNQNPNIDSKPKWKLFGPKLASNRVYETLRILKKLFPFRHCNLDIEWRSTNSGFEKQMGPERMLQKEGGVSPSVSENFPRALDKNLVQVTNRVIDFPCLDYSIKRCPGPCIGAVTPDEYKKIVQQIMAFLEGETTELKNSLKEQMKTAASQKLFEKAARIRDKLIALEGITERQKVTDLECRDTDVINFVTELGRVYFNVFMIRGGKLISSENFVLDALEMKKQDFSLEFSEVLESFLTQYYEKAAEIPEEILIPETLENGLTLEHWLAQKSGYRVQIFHPRRATHGAAAKPSEKSGSAGFERRLRLQNKIRLLELSRKNAEQFAKQYRIKWMAEQKGETALAQLAEILGKKEAPKRIEGFDISHLGGNETVGSMVVFENGLPKSSDYRRFKLRTVVGKPDDYRSMKEILMRRLKYLAKSAPHKGIKIRTPGKKDFEEIKKIIEKELLSNENLAQKDFLAAKRGGEIVGFGRVQKLDQKVSIISDLWVAPDSRGVILGYKIMKKLISRAKLKKVYIDTNKKLEEYYAVFGFVALKNPPEILTKHAQKLDRKLRTLGRKIPPTEDLAYLMLETTKCKTADPSFTVKPNLLVIDGGKGQLSAALQALKRLKLEIPVISLAKQLEEIYLPGEKAPLLLEEGDEALKLLQRIRDESHRFAITFQRDLRGKRMLQ